MGLGSQDLQFKILASVAGQQAIDKLESSMGSLAKSAKALPNALALLAAAFTVEKSIEFGKSILDNADVLGKLSSKTGVSVEQLAKLQGAAQMADVPLESLAKGLAKLGKNTVDASNGNHDLSVAFQKLGIATKDQNGNIKNSGDVLKELADKFSGMRDGPEKAKVAIQLFGKAGADLIPLLNQGSEEMERFGLSIDTDFATKATNFNDALKSISINLKNGAIDNLKELLPALSAIAEGLDAFTKHKSESIGFMELLGEAARLAAQAMVVGFSAANETIDRLITAFKKGKAMLTGDMAQATALGDAFLKRMKENDARERAFMIKTTRGSVFFGDEVAGIPEEPSAPKKKKTATLETAGEFDKILHAMDERLAKMKAEGDAVGQNNAVKAAAVMLSELEAKGISKSSAAYQTYSEKILAVTTALETAKEKQLASDFLQKQDEQIALQKITIENYGLAASELQKLVDAKTLDNQAAEASKRFTDEGRDAYLKATEAVKAHKAALVDLQDQQKRTWTVGASEALRDYLENARNVAQQTKELFSHAFQNMEDSLVQFVKSGQLNFQKFADDVITDLIRIQVRAVIVQSIAGVSNLFSYLGSSGAATGAETATASDGAAIAVNANAKGGVMTSMGPMNLRAYSKGGIASSAQLALFGEGSQPEAYVPLPDGRSIPVSMKGGGGGAVNVSVNVNMAQGTSESSGGDAKGSQLGKLISMAVKNEIMTQMRPGGLLA
jgi:lambda family phage tail tape measure protein